MPKQSSDIINLSIGIAGIIVTIVGIFVAITIPELRCFFELEKECEIVYEDNLTNNSKNMKKDNFNTNNKFNKLDYYPETTIKENLKFNNEFNNEHDKIIIMIEAVLRKIERDIENQEELIDILYLNNMNQYKINLEKQKLTIMVDKKLQFEDIKKRYYKKISDEKQVNKSDTLTVRELIESIGK